MILDVSFYGDMVVWYLFLVIMDFLAKAPERSEIKIVLRKLVSNSLRILITIMKLFITEKDIK